MIKNRDEKRIKNEKEEYYTMCERLKLPREEKQKLRRHLIISAAWDEARIKLIRKRKKISHKQAEKWLYDWDKIEDKKQRLTKWKKEIGSPEEFIEIIGKTIKEEERKAKEIIKKLKLAFPTLPVVKIDRTTSEALLPLFLTKGIFSNFNKIPHIQDLTNKEGKKIGRKLTAKERRDLEIETGEYKKEGYVWREFTEYAIGFGYEHFKGYLEKIERDYKKKKEEIKIRPLLFPDMKRKIEEVLRKVRLYKKGQALAYGILGEVFLQKTSKGVSLLKGNAVYYIGRNPKEKTPYKQVKEILNSLRWLEFRIISKEGLKIKGKGVGNFISFIYETPKEYILNIEPVYVGCIQHFVDGEKELRSKKERKELFSRGYSSFPMKALAISGEYSISTEEFRNYILRETGNSHLNTNKYKVLSQKIKVYIKKARLKHSRRQRNYKAFIEETLSTLIRDKFIVRTEPSSNELKTLTPKRGYETNLKIYIQGIKDLDRSLEQVLKRKIKIWNKKSSNLGAKVG